MSGSSSRHFAFIDSIRGYAVALVILCHATYLLPNLPYPVHRLTVLGWHGVQLFFLASTVTLMMSYEHEVKRNGRADIFAFFLRRFFRIAPAYYAMALFYAIFRPVPPGGFSIGQGLASLAFINAWTPHWMGVTPSDWNVVPGNWSIGLSVFVVALSRARFGLLVNPVMGLVGRVSFSAYLSHFAVLDLIQRAEWLHKPLAIDGYGAIAAFLLLMLIVYPVVIGISWIMYRVIEIPMINLGKSLIARRRVALSRAAA